MGAIAEYIIDTYGDGRLIPPPKTPERLRYTYWLHYAEGSAMPPLLLKLLFTLMPKRAPALLRPLVRKVANQALTTLVNPQLKQHMAFWEGELGKSEWFAGSAFTAADVQMSFPLEAAAARASSRVTPRRWPIWNAFTPARLTSAHWRRAGRIWSGASASSPLLISNWILSGCDHFLDQASEAADIAGGIDKKSPRRTITRCCDGIITMRWPRSPDAKKGVTQKSQG